MELLYRAKYKPRNGTGVLVISPTRELAMQIYSVARELMKQYTQTHGKLPLAMQSWGCGNGQSVCVELQLCLGLKPSVDS